MARAISDRCKIFAHKRVFCCIAALPHPGLGARRSGKTTLQGFEDTLMRNLAGTTTRPRPGAHPGEGAGFTETPMVGDNPGALRMLSYVPDHLPSNAPLVVVLHGCTQHAAQNAAGAGWVQLADRLGFAVLAPEQTGSNNLNRCFNWFLGDDTRRGRGECASIAQMVAAMTDRHALDRARVFVTGLSAGGAMTAAMLAAYPDLFAGGAIIAGLPYGVAHNLQGAMAAMRGAKARDADALAASLVDAWAGQSGRPLRLSIWHGDKDAIVDPSNATALAQQFSRAAGSLPMIGSHQISARLTRTRWGDAAPGGALIELNLVHGLGHGTPLSTLRPQDVGSPAPFLLECGVSSTLEIARVWGLDASAPGHLDTAAETPAQPPRANTLPPTGVAAQVLGSIERHVPRPIQDVIAQSLRAAGLMK
jgi:poly(hydroxyalkanoate) depolymerase family esterase